MYMVASTWQSVTFMRMLSTRSGTDAFTERARQELMHTLSKRLTVVPDAYAQCTHLFLALMLRAQISSLRACSACASVVPFIQMFILYTLSMRLIENIEFHTRMLRPLRAH